MKECPAIIAALPREVSALVRGWERREVAPHVFVWTDGFAVAACAGMGAVRAALACEAAIAAMPVTALLSVGLAGACDPTLCVGEIVNAGVVMDQNTGEQFVNSQFSHVLVSAQEIASVQEKARLHASFRATAVDMEAATVARFASARGIYFQAMKAISDAADFEMEELGSFATEDGQFREGAFAAYAAVRPRLWRRLMQLARNAKLATESLTREMESQLDWYRRRG